jgi:hypothetical protein
MRVKFKVGESIHTVAFNQTLSGEDAIAQFKKMLIASGEVIGIDTKIEVLTWTNSNPIF